MSKCKILYSTLFALILTLSSFTSKSQNFIIDSISTPTIAYSCSTTFVTINTYLGCTNYTLVNTYDSVVGFNIGIKVLRNYSIICFGALSWPTHTINLGTLSPGTYTITATGNYSGTGIVSTKTKTLVVLDCCPNAAFQPSFTMSDSTICDGDSIICTNTSTGSGLSYKWYVDGLLKSSATNYVAQFSTFGNHNIKLSADSVSCRRSFSSDAEMIEAPTLELGLNKSFCAGLSTQLKAGPGWDSLMWSTSENTNNITISDSGRYTLIARDTSHCRLHYDTIYATLKPTPIVDLGEDTTLCEGQELTLNASNPTATYLWQDNNTAPAYVVTSAGTYWVKVSFPNKCVTRDTIEVAFDPCTGIKDFGSDELINVSPNPFYDFLNINLISGDYPTSIKLYDEVGKLVLTQAHFDKNMRLDVSALSPGIYFLYVQYDQDQRVHKLIKKSQ